LPEPDKPVNQKTAGRNNPPPGFSALFLPLISMSVEKFIDSPCNSHLKSTETELLFAHLFLWWLDRCFHTPRLTTQITLRPDRDNQTRLI
jgi:hypothetical protein